MAPASSSNYEGDCSHGRVRVHECGTVDVDETLETAVSSR